jgi:hypothetical protein
MEALLAQGFELAPAIPPITAEAIGGALYSLFYEHVKHKGPERLAELVPWAVYVTLTPFIGSEQAFAVAVSEGCLSEGAGFHGGAQVSIGPVGGGINTSLGPDGPHKEGAVGVGFGAGVINDAIGGCWTVFVRPGPPRPVWPPGNLGEKF